MWGKDVHRAAVCHAPWPISGGFVRRRTNEGNQDRPLLFQRKTRVNSEEFKEPEASETEQVPPLAREAQQSEIQRVMRVQ